MSTLKLITLNIEGDRHLNLVEKLFLKEKPDVICLQEVFSADLNHLKKKLRMEAVFIPMVNIDQPNKINIAPRGDFGIAILSCYPITEPNYEYYEKHAGKIPIFDDNDPNSVDRVLLTAKIVKENNEFQIATTHFTWSDHGQTTNRQRQSLVKLFQILNRVGECILCGDFNAPRGKEIYLQICQRFTDNVPADIITTLDNKIHRVPAVPQLVVDYIFTSKIYQAHDVQVIGGVSDHKAICTNLQKLHF